MDIDSSDGLPREAIVERLESIESLPLEQRAARYVEVQEQLRSTLEGSDSPR